MPIIDVHAHLGYDEIFEEEFTAAELLAAQEENGVDITIVQPGVTVTLESARRQHDAIADLMRRYPGRFYGMANPNPHLPEDQYRAEVTRCLTELGFVGIKIHTFAHAISPASQAARKVFALAAEFDIPVMVHTGSGAPFALPSQVLPAARAFPTVRIILAHSGMMVYASEALQVAQLCSNVYLETTWTGGFLVRQFCRTIGPDRVLFGSDHADNQATELVKMRTCGLKPEELAWCLGGTAARVFRLPIA